MILDLHVHSVFSGDSPTEVEDYARRLLKIRESRRVDGFVLMEHNRLVTSDECDVAGLSAKYGVVILAGVEIDTHWGHLLAYGIGPDDWNELEARGVRKHEPLELARYLKAKGIVAAPSHPFRGFIGMGTRCSELEGVTVIETLNGSDTEAENGPARKLAERLGYAGIGGSDAHFAAELGNGLTEFANPVRTMDDLVRELRAGRCRPLRLDDCGRTR